MHAPLRYQLTAHDCGPTSVLNALAALFEVNELPPEVLKHIYAVTLDRYIGPDGSRGGTSGTSLAYLAWWLNDYASRTGFPVQARALEGDEVTLGEGSFIDEKVKDGAVAVVECCLGYDHYVLVPVNDEAGTQTSPADQLQLSAEDIKAINAARPYISNNLPKLLDLVKLAKEEGFTKEQQDKLESWREKIQQRVDVLVRCKQVIKDELRTKLIEADITLEIADSDEQGPEHSDDPSAAQ